MSTSFREDKDSTDCEAEVTIVETLYNDTIAVRENHVTTIRTVMKRTWPVVAVEGVAMRQTIENAGTRQE